MFETPQTRMATRVLRSLPTTYAYPPPCVFPITPRGVVLLLAAGLGLGYFVGAGYVSSIWHSVTGMFTSRDDNTSDVKK